MKEDDINEYFPCPCYKKTCTDCPKGFEKVLDLKNAGLVIYRHSTKPEKDNQNAGRGGSDLGVDGNGFIFHNTKDADIISKDFLPEMEKRAIKCVRCRRIMEHAINILQKVSAISKNEIIGICDHCKLKAHPCCDCEGALRDFFDIKKEANEIVLTKKRVGKWLRNVQSEFKDYFVDEKEACRERLKDHINKYKHTDKKRRRPSSEVRIGQLCRQKHARSERELEIRELCRESDEQGLARPYPAPITADKSKKQIIFSLDDRLEVDDSILTMSLDRNTKFAVPKSKELSTRIEDQIYSPTIPKKYKDSTRDDRLIKDTYLIEPGTQYYYGDDILPARHPTQYAHDTEKRRLYKEEETIEEKQQSDFIFSFPIERKKEEKLEREKSSSELISDIHDRIREKNEETMRKNEENRLKKIEEEERKQRTRQEKMKLAEEKHKLDEEKKLMEKKARDFYEDGRLFDDTMSLKDKTSSTTLKMKQSKSEADQNKPHSKSKLGDAIPEIKESKTKSETKLKLKPEELSSQVNKEQKKPKAEPEIDSKQHKAETKSELKEPKTASKQPKAESKEPKSESKSVSKQSKADLKPPPKTDEKADSKEPKVESKAESKQPKVAKEPKSESKDVSKQSKGEPKADSKPHKTDVKADSKEPQVESKAESKQSKAVPKEPKSETEAEPKADSKPHKTDVKADSREPQVELKAESKQSKAYSKQPKSEVKSELNQHDAETKSIQKSQTSANKDASKSKKPLLTEKIISFEPAKPTVQRQGPKAEPKDSKFKSDSKAPPESKGTNKDLSKSENVEIYKVEKDTEKEMTANILLTGQKKTETLKPLEESNALSKEMESAIKAGKNTKTKIEDKTRIPRRQVEAQLAPQVQEKKPKKPKEELNFNNIKMLPPSQNYLFLDLVKVKDRGKRTLSQIMTPSQIHLHGTEHKAIKQQRCPWCINSNLELDYESRKKIITGTKEMIAGRIIRGVPAYTEEKEDEAVKPILFQIKYDDKFQSEVIEPPRREYPEERKPAKVLPEEESKGVIRYALSDRTFIEKGWTMLPTEKVVRKMNVYRMRPAHPEFDWFVNNRSKRLMTYDSGERLAEFDDDGHGRWFYRNQRLALQYYDAEELNAQQRFVIYSNGEPDEHGRTRPYTILATFDYLGNGIVFDHGGKIRLKYNQTEGVLLDRNIGPVTHWKWHTLNDPPVLQQVMIDTHMSYKDPQILKMGTAHDKKQRQDNEDMLAIEFDNFIKEKSKKLTQKFEPFQIKMKAMKINEHFSLKVLDQANVYLIYRDGTTNIKLNLGMLLDHKEIVDTDTAEVGEVASNMERLPARTDSLAAMQKSVAYAQHFEKTRTERERRLRLPEPSASADKLTAAVSRPLRLPLCAAQSSTATSTCPKSRKPACNNVYYDNRLC